MTGHRQTPDPGTDAGALTRALELPVFELDSKRFLRRFTFAAVNGRIEKVWYPVFPPGGDTDLVIQWLSDRG
jgi:hypothetical protein